MLAKNYKVVNELEIHWFLFQITELENFAL